jgi:hypothetical protein
MGIYNTKLFHPPSLLPKQNKNNKNKTNTVSNHSGINQYLIVGILYIRLAGLVQKFQYQILPTSKTRYPLHYF